MRLAAVKPSSQAEQLIKILTGDEPAMPRAFSSNPDVVNAIF
jgi:hypothetical protein